jgi:hypothetical protein
MKGVLLYSYGDPSQLRYEETAVPKYGDNDRAAGAASAAEQSRWAAKSARWDGLLTFSTKGEIIIFVGRNSRFARTLEAVLALLAHLFFVHHRKLFSAHSKFLRGGQSCHSWQRPRDSSNSILRHSSPPSTEVERSKLFPKSRRSLLRATRPMLFFIYRKER